MIQLSEMIIKICDRQELRKQTPFCKLQIAQAVLAAGFALGREIKSLRYRTAQLALLEHLSWIGLNRSWQLRCRVVETSAMEFHSMEPKRTRRSCQFMRIMRRLLLAICFPSWRSETGRKFSQANNHSCFLRGLIKRAGYLLGFRKRRGRHSPEFTHGIPRLCRVLCRVDRKASTLDRLRCKHGSWD